MTFTSQVCVAFQVVEGYILSCLFYLLHLPLAKSRICIDFDIINYVDQLNGQRTCLLTVAKKHDKISC